MTSAIGGNEKRVVLLSGGVDSTALLNFHLRQCQRTLAMFVDYGQPALEYERESARRISAHFQVDLCEVRCAGLRPTTPGYVQARNAALIFLAAMSVEPDTALIAIGIHAGTTYYDCTPQFAADVQQVFDGYANGKLILSSPFLNWTKAMIHAYAKENRLPVHLCRSCESRAPVPCGTCVSCRDREVLNARS